MNEGCWCKFYTTCKVAEANRKNIVKTIGDERSLRERLNKNRYSLEVSKTCADNPDYKPEESKPYSFFNRGGEE